MNVAEITKLSTREKFELMEALWEDMKKKVEKCGIPQEHIKLLDARRLAVESGEDRILDWDRVKHSLRRP
jgi:putative addiction module component (TIGR02574 family)